MVDTVGGSMESVEGMGPQMRGTVKIVHTLASGRGMASIIPDSGGKDIIFYDFGCIDGKKGFDSLSEGMKVSFSIQETEKGSIVMNVAMDTSGETKSLWKKVSDSVWYLVIDSNIPPSADDQGWLSEMPTSIENIETMGPAMTGNINWLNISNNIGTILANDGKVYTFNSKMCKDEQGTFNTLESGIRVTFNKVEHNPDGTPTKNLLAQNVAVEVE